MNTSKRTIITVGAAVFVVASSLVLGQLLNNNFEKNDNNKGMHSSVADENGSYVQRDSSTYKTYAALTGDAYDSAFIENMIIHHEGAVTMAESALAHAKRQEIKDLAQEIISAQNKEITEMKQWQQQWRYTSTTNSSATMSEGHGSMGMEMADMHDILKDKTGDAFDEAFLEQMIIHHQDAINMAAPGEQNAKHQEVKDLTRAIIEAQTREIKQMQMWQNEWGF